LKPDIKIYHPIEIAIQYDSQMYGPSVSLSKKTNNTNKKIRVAAATSDVIYTGTRKPLSIQVFNDSGKDIKEFKVKLNQKTKFIAQLESTNDHRVSIFSGGYGGGFGYMRYKSLEKKNLLKKT